jgi:hypothetical protein
LTLTYFLRVKFSLVSCIDYYFHILEVITWELIAKPIVHNLPNTHFYMSLILQQLKGSLSVTVYRMFHGLWMLL